ncbi:hypothetical protein D915_000031 [Fasciola hepatica]|uniref:Inner centromere protein ARK-binding domain-containing protein n=1 Tax=Fasciola hepatica TaxID=6192 RepID=A0A4E0RN60_FASHE|nr:hypothetical protein D915_000031 [Fasciola hepatica]
MGPESRLVSAIYGDFLSCKRQIEKIWSDIDEICVDVVNSTVSLCLNSVAQSLPKTSKLETSIAPKRRSSVTIPESAPDNEEISKASAAKKPKLSLHSRKCEHSPHNQRSKRRVGRKICAEIPERIDVSGEKAETSPEKDANSTAKPQSPKKEESAPLSSTKCTDPKLTVMDHPLASTVSEQLVENRQTDVASRSPNNTFDVLKSAVRESKLPLRGTVESLSGPPDVASQVTSSTVTLAKRDVILPVPSRSPSVDTVSVVSQSSGNTTKVTSVHDSLRDIPQNEPRKIASKMSSVSVNCTDSELNSGETNSNAFDQSLTINQSHTGLVSGGTSKSSLVMERSMLASKMRPFCSAERLGGVSRLNTLSVSACSTQSDTLQRASQRSGMHSTLNSSRSGTIRTMERSQSVLAMKEQLVAEKQRIYRERFKENAERLRAFHEAKEREREAQRRANEERRLAVKNKAQQLAEMQRIIAENKKRIEKTRAEADAAKQKTNTATKPACLSRITDKENQPMSHTRKPVMGKTASSQSVQSKLTPNAPQATVRLQHMKLPPSSTLKPIQSNSQSISVAHTNQTAPKPTSVVVEPMHSQPVIPAAPSVIACSTNSGTPTSVSVSVVTPSETRLEQAHPNLDASTANETFDMSQLKSDSDSDEEQPNRKIPSWCRKGNQNLIDTLRLIHSGQLKWPSEFTTATQMTFDLEEVFRGYKFQRKPRTSSGIWNASSGQCTREH